MNINYSGEIMDMFYSPKHIYTNQQYNLIGFAGQTNVGEYVHLYFWIDKTDNFADSKIVYVIFSAIGSVLLIAAAEKFCSLIEGMSFQAALKYCDPISGLQCILAAPDEKLYLINFVVQAFYKAFEDLANNNLA